MRRVTKWEVHLARAKAARLKDEEGAVAAKALAESSVIVRKKARAAGEKEYIAMVRAFVDELRPEDFRTVEIYKTRNPPLGWRKKVEALVVPGVASRYSYVNGNPSAPTNADDCGLLVIPGLRAAIVGSTFYNPRTIPMQLYRERRGAGEPVRDLEATFSNSVAFGHKPEHLPQRLLEALARWAAERRPDLNLRL